MMRTAIRRGGVETVMIVGGGRLEDWRWGCRACAAVENTVMIIRRRTGLRV